MATYGGAYIDESFVAATDLSSYQYRFVMTGSVAGEVTIATGGSQKMPIGVLQNDPVATDVATVRLFGLTKLHVNGLLSSDGTTASSFVHGDPIVCGSDGKGLHSNACIINAIALDTAASINTTITALVVPPGMRLAVI
jgi:hypothetical protein